MNTNNDVFNPDDFDAIPEHLIANEQQELMQYSDTEKVTGVASDFLNIDGAEFGYQLWEALEQGHIDPIRLLLIIKKMNHVHDFFLGSDKARTHVKAKAYLKDKISNTIGKQKYEAYGAAISIETVGGATTMDYKECGDIYLNRLYELASSIKERIKERETFIKTQLPAESNTIGIRSIKDTIKTLPEIQEVPLEEERTINLNPPVKTTREGIVVRFARKKK